MRKNTAHAALFLIFLLAVTSVFAQARRSARRATTRAVSYQAPRFTPPVIEDEPIVTQPAEDAPTPQAWPETRLTKQINSNQCEAYPWISSDGLRLYFSSNRDGGHGNIYFSERKNLDEPFEEAKKVFQTKENKYYAASLTADELTMYLTLEGYTLYIAERKSRTEPFGTPRVIPELKSMKLFGPGISADGSEMMVIDYTQRNGKGQQTIWLVKGTDGKFTEKATLKLPEGLTSGPGQISKDGLTYYCSLERQSGQGEHLYRYTRNTMGAEFTLAGKMAGDVNVTRENLQPSVNGDGTIMAYVINNDGSWSGDDIRVVKLDGDKVAEDNLVLVAVKPVAAVETVKVDVSKIKITPANITNVTVPVLPKAEKAVTEPIIRTSLVNIYPNPFTELLTIEFLKPLKDKVLLELFDVNGKRVLAQQISGEGTIVRVKTGNLSAGQFTCRISGSEGVVYSGTLISGK